MTRHQAQTHAIRIDSVCKSFGEVNVLVDISLEIAPGETVVICGPSGSGKSTLLRCLNGLERHDAGTIDVLGRTVSPSTMRDTAFRVLIGMVFQKFTLFPHMSVMNNLCLAPTKVLGVKREVAEQRAIDVLRKVGLEEKVNAWPQELSGGQQQRVAIARALVLQPEILLFDEPTSALDPETIREVLDVMRSLAKGGMTLVVVTHELRFARDVAHRIVFMDHGRIAEVATTQEFFTQPKAERSREFLREILNH